MGASRKLQGEIDRVLKKVQEGVEVFDSIWNKVYDTENANQKEKFEADLKKEIKKLQRYRDQIKTWIQSSEIKDKKALMESRKLIEREMERFKVCEKETKTKAFSKEGLGQQPKTDPKEKARAESRDWINNVVTDLNSQIDNFEAEIEGFQVKKGKTRPPRLIHLEKSIARHKTHIKKLESILRLLDNDELSPDEVNDVKDLLEDYVERNQDDFDDFSDVDDFYSTLPPEKVEALEDMVSLGPSSLVKASLSTAPDPSHDQAEDTASQDSNSDVPRTPPPKSTIVGTSVTLASPAISGPVPTASVPTIASASPVRPSVGISLAAPILSVSANAQAPSESTSVASSFSAMSSSASKMDETMSLPIQKPSSATSETAKGLGLTRGAPGQLPASAPITLPPNMEGSGSVPLIPELAKRNILNIEERATTTGLPLPPNSPLDSKVMLQQTSMEGIGAGDSTNMNGGSVIGGRVFPQTAVSGTQWKPPTVSSLHNQNELNQLRGRPEIAPDQREKFLQRLQQVQQQSHMNILGTSHIQGLNQKQFPVQQQNLIVPQNVPNAPQLNLGLGSTTMQSLQQQPSILQQSNQHLFVSAGAKDGEAGLTKSEEQQQLTINDDINTEHAAGFPINKSITEEEMKTRFLNMSSNTMGEGNHLSRETDLLPGHQLQSGLPSPSVGVIGRRSIPDLGAVGDSSSVASNTHNLDHSYNMQLLEAAFCRIPQQKDSERVKSYSPRQPTDTPSSFPQVQAPIISNPAFWERFGLDNFGTDVLFFAFYYQQNTYQQYLAARELKKQSWRYHRKYNTWFQRHSEPETTTDEFERGSYVLFDYRFAEDGSGWRQRIWNDFTFEYVHLEDELQVQQA